MTEKELVAYCDANGVPHKETVLGGVSRFRVMDPSQLPDHMRELLDERGCLKSQVVTKEPELESAPAPVEAEQPKGKLPLDFPHHKELDEAGIHTYTQLRKALDDEVKIPGIGEAKEAKIREALEN